MSLSLLSRTASAVTVENQVTTVQLAVGSHKEAHS
jgi:hypothetical protein